MDDLGYSGNNLIERRYDAIVHMVTAAEGAEEFYNYSNAARFEDEEGARARDHKLRDAYLGHEKHLIVDNSQNTNFEDKIKKSIGLVSSVVGLPTDTRIFKKYLVSPDALNEVPEGIT